MSILQKDVIGEAVEYLLERKYVNVISIKMLLDIKPKHALIGYSESKKLFLVKEKIRIRTKKNHKPRVENCYY